MFLHANTYVHLVYLNVDMYWKRFCCMCVCVHCRFLCDVLAAVS